MRRGNAAIYTAIPVVLFEDYVQFVSNIIFRLHSDGILLIDDAEFVGLTSISLNEQVHFAQRRSSDANICFDHGVACSHQGNCSVQNRFSLIATSKNATANTISRSRAVFGFKSHREEFTFLPRSLKTRMIYLKHYLLLMRCMDLELDLLPYHPH